MSALQQLLVIFFILHCSVFLILHHQQKEERRCHRAYEPQNLDSYFDPFLKLFGKELATYIIRVAISVGIGTLATLCGKTENSVVILVLLGILVGLVAKQVLLYR